MEFTGFCDRKELGKRPFWFSISRSGKEEPLHFVPESIIAILKVQIQIMLRMRFSTPDAMQMLEREIEIQTHLK